MPSEGSCVEVLTVSPSWYFNLPVCFVKTHMHFFCFSIFVLTEDEQSTPTRSAAGSVNEVCRFWARGYCRFGEDCRFLHTTALPSADKDNTRSSYSIASNAESQQDTPSPTTSTSYSRSAPPPPLPPPPLPPYAPAVVPPYFIPEGVAAEYYAPSAATPVMYMMYNPMMQMQYVPVPQAMYEMPPASAVYTPMSPTALHGNMTGYGAVPCYSSATSSMDEAPPQDTSFTSFSSCSTVPYSYSSYGSNDSGDHTELVQAMNGLGVVHSSGGFYDPNNTSATYDSGDYDRSHTQPAQV